MDRSTEKYILNILREGTIRWSGRTNALRKARKRFRDGRYKNGETKWKWYWRCATCLKWWRDESDVEVDHIEEVGSYEGDLHEYAERMYCDESNLQVLCKRCHRRKTKGNATLRFKRKKKERA